MKVPLRELVIIQKGMKPKKLSSKKFENSIPYLDIETIEKGNITQYADYYSSVQSTEGDIFVLRTGGRNGLILKGKNGAVGSTLFCLTPILIDKNYLYYFLKSNEFSQSGTRDLYNSFWDLKVPIPPLEEQKRIVKVLEIQLNDYQKDFDTANNELNKLIKSRRSIIEEAITGKLTDKWRKENGFNTKDWTLKHLDDTADIMLGKMLDKAKNQGKLVKYLRNINVRWFSFDLTDLKKIRITEEEEEKFSLKFGDVLICEGGEPGRSAIWKNQSSEKIVFQKALHRVRPDSNIILPEWIIYCLKLDYDNGLLQKSFTGTTIKHLTLINLKKYQIQVPPIEEQKVIISQLQNHLRVFDEIENKYKFSIEHPEHPEKLPQSVMQTAFKGQLSKFDSKDESTSLLLEKIKIEKEKIEKEHKEIQKSMSKIRSQMNEKIDENKSILQILKTAENQTLTVEELWEETPFSKTKDVELFYEELIKLEHEAIEFSWDDDRKIKTNITLK